MPSLTYRIHDSIRAVHRDAWRQVAGDKFFLTPDYLEAVESAALAGLSFRYVEIFNHSAPAGVFYFQLADLSSRTMGSFLDLSEYGGIAGRAGDLLHRLLFSGKHQPRKVFAVCGSLLVSGNHGYALAHPKYGEPCFKLLPGVLQAIAASEAEAGARVIGVAVKDFYDDDVALAAPLARRGYHRLVIDPNMVVDIDPAWRHFDDYLEAMSSKYRLRANNAFRKLEQVTCRELDLDGLRARAEAIEALYLNVQKKAPVRIVRAGSRYFVAMKETLGDAFVFRTMEKDGRLLAFTTGFRHGTSYDAHFIGIDYHANKPYALYLNILYDFIREAIRARSRTLFFGRTALEIKSTVGAVPRPLTAFLRMHHDLTNRVIGPFIPSTGPSGWTPRNPFKA